MPQKKKGECTIRCQVSPGMFSNERAVVVELPDRGQVVAFVDARDVIVSRDPGPGEEVAGRVRVALVGKDRDSFVVDLPQPTVTGGTRLRVSKRLVD